MDIVFDDNLITGNELVDSEHMELIHRIKLFVDSCEQGAEKAETIQMLDYLIEYTDFHFRDEEKLQDSVSYPEIKQHKEKHAEFEKNLADLKDELSKMDAPTEEFMERVKTSAVDWIFKHIKTFDRSIAEYIFMRENPELL